MSLTNFCEKAAKAKYRSEDAAYAAADALQVFGVSAYQCLHCKQWHLTSQGAKPIQPKSHTTIKKMKR